MSSPDVYQNLMIVVIFVVQFFTIREIRRANERRDEYTVKVVNDEPVVKRSKRAAHKPLRRKRG